MFSSELLEKGEAAREAAHTLSLKKSHEKNTALLKMAAALRHEKNYIISANGEDMRRGKEKNLSHAFLDRLLLDEDRIEDMAAGLEDLASLPDPVGRRDKGWLTEEGLEISKVRVPVGVIGIIYEARPNVTADAAGICLKTGNAVILRGGSDAIESNKAVAGVLSAAAVRAGMPEGSIGLIEDTDRKTAVEMMKFNRCIDMLIPRGGAGLISNVVENATVPVIETGTGNCHVYVSSSADLRMASDIVVNGKTQRPAVCNSTETMLVSREIAGEFLPLVFRDLEEKKVELVCCPESLSYASAGTPAAEEDYVGEALDLRLSVKVVGDVKEAMEHIRRYGTKHSEVIVTEDYSEAEVFLAAVDAAAVYVNASSRFTDGGRFGFGAEIGISTQKLHARGPMGLDEMTSYKYVIRGTGQIRR